MGAALARPLGAPTPRPPALRNSKAIIDAFNPFPDLLDVYGLIAPGDINHGENDLFKDFRSEVAGIQAGIENAGSTYFVSLIISILFMLLWVYLFLYIQLPLGILEVLLWWFLNPWWDLFMLTGFAWANAAWQNCAMCGKNKCGGECSCSKSAA